MDTGRRLLCGPCYTPAPTYFRLTTIIGPKGLTSEFGMGSGVAPWVRAPGIRSQMPDHVANG